MRPEHIEAWVLSLVDDVKHGARIEDSRVELKAEWPEPRKAARRIAGHANASGGDSVLWVIGLDERKGVVGCNAANFADWHAQINAEFDGIQPTVTDLRVSTEGGQLTALLFDTSRRPYVVKNPAHGSAGGDPVALEVPWRAGTAIRSARREELIRILVPLQTLPTVELLSARASSKRKDAADQTLGGSVSPIERLEHLNWDVTLALYVTPRTPEQVVFPVHRSFLSFRPLDFRSNVRKQPWFNVPTRPRVGGIHFDSHTIVTTASEIIITGPGKLYARVSHYEPLRPLPSGQWLDVILSLTPAGQDRAVEINISLVPDKIEGDYDRSWKSSVDLDAD